MDWEVLLELSRTFHYIPHNVLMAKLDAFGSLKYRKRFVKINIIYTLFLEFSSSLRQIASNIISSMFLNDFILFRKNVSFHNCVDETDLTELIKIRFDEPKKELFGSKKIKQILILKSLKLYIFLKICAI